MTVDGTASIRRTSVLNDDANRDLIFFWGSPFVFSEWILRVAEVESGEMKVARVEDYEDLTIPEGARAYIFFDDAVARRLLASPDTEPVTDDAARWVHGYKDEGLARQMLATGRSGTGPGKIGLLPMNMPIDAWTTMFRVVLSGDYFVPGSLLEGHGGSRSGPASGGMAEARLTPREREVLRLVARGMRNKSIARELGLSEHTIKLHLHHVISKIGVHNRTQATQWYLTRSG